MKLGIMQPYFFPYLGYFELINYADRWVIFDEIQFIRHGWVDRNRILHPNESWQYVRVQLKKHSRDALISDVEAATDGAWKRRLLGQLTHYKKSAPHYASAVDTVEQVLDTDETSVAKVNGRCLKIVCERLGIGFEEEYFSEMGLELGTIEGPGDWAFEISRVLKADEYVNPPGGRDLFDPEKFAAAGIDLNIRTFPNMEYPTGRFGFEPGLSIIDVMMWNSMDDIKSYLDSLE